MYIYKGNTDIQRKQSYRGDWVVIICNHEKSDQSQELEINCDIKTIQLEYFNKNCKHFNETCKENEEILNNGDWTSSTTSDNSSNSNQNEKRNKNSINGNVQQVQAEVHHNTCTTTVNVNGNKDLNFNGEYTISSSNVNIIQDGDAIVNKNNKRLFSNKKPSKHKVSMLIHRHTLWPILLYSF